MQKVNADASHLQLFIVSLLDTAMPARILARRGKGKRQMTKGRIESVERALSILSAFSSQRRRMTLTELAEETGLHKSTVLRQANSMLLYGFLTRDAGGAMASGPPSGA